MLTAILQIKNKEEEIERLRERAVSMTCSMDGDRVTSSSNGDAFERSAIAWIQAKSELQQKIEELVTLKYEVMNVIDALDGAREINLLYKRYVHLKSWKQIAKEMNYSLQGIHKIHGIALQKIQKILKSRVK